MIYLDNAASSYPKPPSVIEAVSQCMLEIGANPGRGQHRVALEAGRIIMETRRALAELIGASDPSDIFFTGNATEALNLAIKGWVRPGDEVVTTMTEHNSVYRPLANLEKRHNVRVEYAAGAADGAVDLKDLARLVHKGVRLVVVSHASNVIGNIQPLADILEIAGKKKVPVLVDAAQTAGLLGLDVEGSGIDMLAFTGHKALLGPQGTGGLYVRPDLEINELMHGGTGAASKGAQPRSRPERYESGTQNTPGIAGLRASLKFVREKGLPRIFLEETARVQTLIDELERIKGVKIFGPKTGEKRAPLVSITLMNKSVQQLSLQLDREFGICARAGFLCAPKAHDLIGTEDTGVLRLSPGVFTTDEDIGRVVDGIKEIAGGK